MSDGTEINAAVSGGTVGVAGAQDVRIGSQTFINNFYGPTPQAEIAKPTGPIPPCPYPGLAYFGPNDASRFFGREQAIQGLITAVTKRSFTALVGASGSGKSSVVLAGLWPRLVAQGSWRSTYFRIGTEPDKNPFASLARALEPLTGERGLPDKLEEVQKLAEKIAAGSISLANVIAHCRTVNPGHILLIADQFEEVFTLVSDETLRNRFIDALIAAFPDPAQGSTPDASFVLTLRADFVSQAINYRPLADKLKDRVEYLGPMTREELRDAIVEPAKAVRVEFEPGLVNTILDDVEKRPGSLPLLQFALREMWGQLKTPLMTRADYDAIGGVEGALAKRAQAIFDDATHRGKDETAVALYRRLFTRLVTVGEGAEDTRRIVGREELGPEEWTLAQKLAGEDNRLVVTASTVSGLETAEVVHEALIRGWPTLVDWVQGDRAFLFWRHQLKPRLDDWRADPTDEGAYLRGKPLTVAQEWAAKRASEINEDERLFILSSAKVTYEEKKASLDVTRKRLARVTEVLARTKYNLITITEGKVLDVFFGLLKHFIFSYVFVVAITLFQIGGTYEIVQSLMETVASDFSGYLLFVALIASLTILLPMIFKYMSSCQNYRVKQRLALSASSLPELVKGATVSYYALLGLISYMMNVIVAYLMLSVKTDPHPLNTVIVVGVSFLYTGIYTVIIAILIDMHILGWHGIRLVNRLIDSERALDGIIVGGVIGSVQILQSALMAQLLHRETRLDIFVPSLLFTTFFCFVVGMYAPYRRRANSCMSISAES